MNRKQLCVDPARRLHGATPKLQQYVRANDEQGYGETVAVEELDKESFLVWVHSRDSRVFVEDCLGHVLGYGALHFRSPLGAYPGPVPAIADPFEDRLQNVLALLDAPVFYEGGPAALEEIKRIKALAGAREPDCRRCGTGNGLCNRHAEGSG